MIDLDKVREDVETSEAAWHAFPKDFTLVAIDILRAAKAADGWFGSEYCDNAYPPAPGCKCPGCSLHSAVERLTAMAQLSPHADHPDASLSGDGDGGWICDACGEPMAVDDG